MIAVDTNVVVRLLVGDDPRQTDQARRLFATETIFLPKTVILEAEWVLRRLYKVGRPGVLKALSGLIALPNVRCEDEAAIVDALAWADKGLDFADALHLASSHQADRLATFDEDFRKRAGSLTAGFVVGV